MVRAYKLIILLLLAFNVKAQIPFPTRAVGLYDGTIRIVSGDTVLLDKSGNNRNLKIKNVDFDISNAQLGIPYKTLAYILAPAGDATFQAADDSFFYKNGNPDSIRLSNLFQDINYTHKIFCKHTAQVVDANSKEVYIPRVKQIAVYNAAMTGTDSLRCLQYFGVPAENTNYATGGAIWLSGSPLGNDANTGTKASPKRSLDNIKNTNRSIVYTRSGSYDMGATSSSFSTTYTIQGTGKSTAWLASGSTGCAIDGAIAWKNFELYDSATTIGFNVRSSSFIMDKCFIRNPKGTHIIHKNVAATSITVSNTNFESVNNNILNINVAGTFTYNFTGNYGILKTTTGGTTATTVNFKYNKGTGTSASTNTFTTGALNYKDNTSLQSLVVNSLTSRVVLQDEAINFTCQFSDSTYINRCVITLPTSSTFTAKCDSFLNTSITGSTTGTLLTLTAKNNMLAKGFAVTNTGVNGSAMFVSAAANSNITGVVIDSGTINTDVTTQYGLYVGETAQQAGVNAIQAAVIKRLKITNNNTGSLGTESGHLTFLGGGNNHQFFQNELNARNGYFMVIKNGGNSYADTIPDIYSNVYNHIGSNNMLKGIYNRGADSVFFCNNTILNWKSASNLFECDNNASGQANSLFVKNNLITLSANTGYQNGNVISRYNAMNKNGFTATLTTADTSVTVSYSSDGTPATRLNFGQALTGTGRNTMFASGYIVPTAILTRNQDATWQPGAVIIP
jgi:hypothetical protein